MKILKATNYGFRTVIQVLLNPDDSEWVHVVGSQIRDAAGHCVVDGRGEPVLITDVAVPMGEPGDTCHNCRYNHRVKEIIFDGDGQFYTNADGQWVRKTEGMFLEELRGLFPLPSPVLDMPSLVGIVI